MIKRMKSRQERMTFEDTISSQRALSSLLQKKIISPVLSDRQKADLPSLVAKSLLSFGAMNSEMFFTRQGVLNLGSLHTALLRQIDWAVAPEIIVKQRGRTFRVNMSDLWKHLYNRCLDWFPLALGESLRHSKEVLKRDESKGYGFSAEEKVQ